jgi:hypothetical protein
MYLLCLLALTVASLAARLVYIDSYPFGFSQHAVVHAENRRRIYEAVFINNWDSQTWTTVRDIILQVQHGPQSLVEALLTPLFGFGFTESRLIVTTLGILSLALIVAWGTVAINRWFGLLAGLTIGMAPYALYFSRYGDSEHVNIYLHGFLLLYAAQRVVQRGFFRDYALLGLASALSLYVYATNQMLCGLVIGIVGLFQILPVIRNGWLGALGRVLSFLVPALLTAGPMINQYLKSGRSLLLRTPYGSPNYEFSQSAALPSRIASLWNELFVQGRDPWFARSGGSLNDHTLLLLIPGVITMVILLARSRRTDSRSLQLFCAITAALVIFGGLPAILSPEPVIRRAVLLAIGLDIVKALGIYGLALLMLRKTPKLLAYTAISALSVTYTAYDWNSFLFHSRAYDSSSGNSPVATIRYVRDLVRNGKEVVVLLPQGPGFLVKDDFTFFLKFDLGYPKELPASIRIVDLPDLTAAPLTNVIVPFTNYQQISSRATPLPKGITPANVRTFSNRQGETFVLVDFVQSPQQG